MVMRYAHPSEKEDAIRPLEPPERKSRPKTKAEAV